MQDKLDYYLDIKVYWHKRRLDAIDKAFQKLGYKNREEGIKAAERHISLRTRQKLARREK